MRKKILAGLALAATAGVGIAAAAPSASASPLSPAVAQSTLFHGRGGIRVGAGVGFGGGYGGGYYATAYHQVYRTWIAGYDAWGRPIYQSAWVTEPYQVWVPAQRYSYGPTFHVGFRFR